MTSRQPSRLSLGPLAIIASIALAGCTAASPSPSASGPGGSTVASASAEPSVAASQPASAEPSAVASEPTDNLLPFACTPSATIPSTTDRAQITDVRVGTHVIAGYDRVVFEFTSGIPDVIVEAVLPPLYADGSGLEMDVAGNAFLKVTMHGASRVSPEGGITYAGSTNFKPGFDQLVQLIEGGDFEAVSTWYLGLNSAGCYRVFTLDDPSRLVIDIEH